MCIEAWIFSFKLVEYFKCYALFTASLIKADILRRHYWLLSRVMCIRNYHSFSFYRVISALRFYWSTFVCETNITAVNWSLIESFRFYDENDYEYEIFSILYIFIRKIHYLTREFHVKLHAKTDIATRRAISVFKCNLTWNSRVR